MFGPPSNLGTFLGLAGAGLTVALKDFVVGFFGWFGLLGPDGIRPGDLVEINGVTGEVIEVGIFQTVLLETGDWGGSSHPTGRRVTFNNSFAIEGHYFNFSTSGQWLWDELQIVVPEGRDPYPISESLRREVEEATMESAQQAEAEWKGARRAPQFASLTATPTVNLRPIPGGAEIAVRYVTRASDRAALRSRLYRAAMELLGSNARVSAGLANVATASGNCHSSTSPLRGFARNDRHATISTKVAFRGRQLRRGWPDHSRHPRPSRVGHRPRAPASRGQRTDRSRLEQSPAAREERQRAAPGRSAGRARRDRAPLRQGVQRPEPRPAHRRSHPRHLSRRGDRRARLPPRESRGRSRARLRRGTQRRRHPRHPPGPVARRSDSWRDPDLGAGPFPARGARGPARAERPGRRRADARAAGGGDGADPDRAPLLRRGAGRRSEVGVVPPGDRRGC